MVEIEIGVLRGLAAWVEQRNNARARIKSMFNTEKARKKLAHAYPDPVKES
jgi:hypothetical protein